MIKLDYVGGRTWNYNKYYINIFEAPLDRVVKLQARYIVKDKCKYLVSKHIRNMGKKYNYD